MDFHKKIKLHQVDLQKKWITINTKEKRTLFLHNNLTQEVCL